MSESISRVDVEEIVVAGNQAPSGENCQPWHFVVRGRQISVYLLPERDASAYGWGQRASYLACGAAIENMIIAASAKKYTVQTTYFPDTTDELCVAALTFTKDSHVNSDPLAGVIAARCTNRKPYESAALTLEQRNALFASATHEGFGTFLLTEDRDGIEQLARIGSTNEEIMLANQSLHAFFFGHINWTKKEDDARKVGFYIETLELPPPARSAFKVLRHWSVMRVLRHLGFQRVVAQQNARTNASAAAIGGFAIPDVTPVSFVRIGRAIERLWLTATAAGLSLQPLTGVLFFKLLLDHEQSNDFSTAEKECITYAYDAAKNRLRVSKERLVFMFRVGRSKPPTAHASRFPLSEAVTFSEL